MKNEISQQAAYMISLTGRGAKTPSVKIANALAKESKKMPTEKFKQVCKLMRDGASITEAKSMMNKYELVRFSAFVPKRVGKKMAIAQMKKALKKRGVLKWKPVYPAEFGR